MPRHPTTRRTPLPPHHQEAFDAIEAGDYARAITAYEAALAENPRDDDARAGLGQVRLLDRVQGLDLQAARDAAAAAPLDPDAQFAVADLDLAGGHVDDAFGRLLDLFAALPEDERAPVRERLLELFGLVGDTDARVIRARGRPPPAVLRSDRRYAGRPSHSTPSGGSTIVARPLSSACTVPRLPTPSRRRRRRS
jgi:tetratricopeptide (TPR) repeat protein